MIINKIKLLTGVLFCAAAMPLMASAVCAQPLTVEDLTENERTSLMELIDQRTIVDTAIAESNTAISAAQAQISALEAEKAKDTAHFDMYRSTVSGSSTNTALGQTIQNSSSNYQEKIQEQIDSTSLQLAGEESRLAELREERQSIQSSIDDLMTLDGSDVVRYALQFEGNPYVYGGTSLTKGADCSGFVMSLYKNFGINVGRSSWDQEKAGTEVSYEEMKPGDIICYDCHVAMYIGGGQIIHAKDSASGIVIEDDPQYAPIRTIRRIFE